MLKALLTFSTEALPPTSRKFAGSPPRLLMISIVAIARPAPFTRHSLKERSLSDRYVPEGVTTNLLQKEAEHIPASDCQSACPGLFRICFIRPQPARRAFPRQAFLLPYGMKKTVQGRTELPMLFASVLLPAMWLRQPQSSASR